MGTLKHGVFSDAINPLSLLQKFAKKKSKRAEPLENYLNPFAKRAVRHTMFTWVPCARARARARAR